ncbi:hypothetical protein [Yoonia sp. SS1-5]|uniref:Uncharacterized protein n=1 Tax=Yoonia rhodophyticola TaxID=3137370 RepID=A0AAN0NHT6_9RHOB
MNPIWFLRAKRWAQHPPSAKKVRFVAAILAICVVLYAIDAAFGWPDALTPNNLRSR